jgi:uncharacterized membrane protein YfcA
VLIRFYRAQFVAKRDSRVELRSLVHSVARVTKLCIFVGTAIGGYAGWALGEMLDLGFGWAFGLSGVGSIVGVWAGWKLAQKIER